MSSAGRGNTGDGQRLTQGEATRIRILEAAGQAFADVGYNDAKLEDIAAAVGITKGAVLRHYSSKEKLFVESYKYVMRDNHSWLDVPDDVLSQGFYAIIGYWFSTAAERSVDSLPLRMYFLGRSCGDLNAQRAINRYLRSEDPDRTIEFVEFGMAQGEIGSDNDPLLAAALLDWAMDGSQGAAFADDLDRSGLFRRSDVEQRRETAEELVLMLRRALNP